MSELAPPDAGKSGDFIAPLLAGLHTALRAGSLVRVSAAALPPGEAALLDHPSHMTSRLERHYGAPVAVQVLQRRWDERRYAREILLTLPPGVVVQYAVVSIALDACPDPVRAAILAEQQPLGRILQQLAADLRVEVVGFVRARLPHALARRLDAPPGADAWGRLVRIHHGAECLIEGLELLAPP